MSLWKDFYDLLDETYSNSAFTFKRKEDGVKLIGRLPGVSPKEMNVDVAGDVISLKWESERGGKGETSFRVGRDYEAAEAKADMVDGMLEIDVPIAASKVKRQIPIQSAKQLQP